MGWTAGASLGAIPYENVGLNHLYCTPNKLWEYPMAGVPILATDLVELGRSLRSNGIGVLLPREFDAADVVRAVNDIDDDGLASMGRACARYAERENWQAVRGAAAGLLCRAAPAFVPLAFTRSRHGQSILTDASDDPMEKRLRWLQERVEAQRQALQDKAETVESLRQRLDDANRKLNQSRARNEELLDAVRRREAMIATLNQRTAALTELVQELRERVRTARHDPRASEVLDHNSAKGSGRVLCGAPGGSVIHQLRRGGRRSAAG